MLLSLLEEKKKSGCKTVQTGNESVSCGHSVTAWKVEVTHHGEMAALSGLVTYTMAEMLNLTVSNV